MPEALALLCKPEYLEENWAMLKDIKAIENEQNKVTEEYDKKA
jgi:hypothetical protein